MTEKRNKTHRLKSSNLRPSIIRRDIINRDTPLSFQSQIHHLRHPLVGAILRAEVHISRPVIREVLAKGTRRAGRFSRRIVVPGSHGRVETVAADDLVHVC